MSRSGRANVWRIWLLHTMRIGMLAVIPVLIHQQAQRRHVSVEATEVPQVAAADLAALLPGALGLADQPRPDGTAAVLDAAGAELGFVLQTSPVANRVVGFSGPTNVLIVFAVDDRIAGVQLLSSGDTREHVQQIQEDPDFLASFRGQTWQQAAASGSTDAVSGATLTSLAIREAVRLRLGGTRQSLRFPDDVTVEDARQLFPSAARLEATEIPGSWQVMDLQQQGLGTLLRTSPHADNLTGYQGPTDALVGLSSGGQVLGVAVLTSYDNEPYVGWVREEVSFFDLFTDRTLSQLGELNEQSEEYEGVSGATMTSQAIVLGLAAAARSRLSLQRSLQNRPEAVSWGGAEVGTAVVILLGLIIGLTSLRGRRRLRWVWQVTVIVWLGLISGELLSQAMFVGWARAGIPWQRAGSLVLLAVAAFLVPIGTRRNIYCTHLCPHGAAQQLLRRKRRKPLIVSPRVAVLLKLIPVVLLVWCLLVALLDWPFSLVSIEPFHAWVFRLAGWGSIGVAIVGLVASWYVPMAYCRYGCPTGALLSYVRRTGRSGDWTWQDWLVAGSVGLALCLSAVA